MSDIILYTTDDGVTKIDLRLEDGTVWLSQLQIADLFSATKQNISLHLKNIFEDEELSENSVVKDSLTTAAAIREKDPETYRDAFNGELKAAITARRNIVEPEPLSYATFKQTGINLNTRFKRYFFARVDEFLAEGMNLNVKHPIADLVTKTGSNSGFHVEHILSWNAENKALFDNDEERFEQERNRLGGILLLKGKDNISSNNEPYQEKLKSYANTLYWNETLREDSYKSKLDLKELMKKHKLDLQALETFGPDEVELRHKLLFQLIELIYK